MVGVVCRCRSMSAAGLGFQWLMCTGILIVGVVVQLIVGTLHRVPEFHPLAMVGGALWATGNFPSSQRRTPNVTFPSVQETPSL